VIRKTPASKEKNNDRDGDGVTDDIDLCPDAPGPVALLGCPDRDGDGIPDKDDRCPDVKGLATNGGCPEMSREDKAILYEEGRRVHFEIARAKLLPASEPSLDIVARLMKKYPWYSLQIDGHTDSQGDDKMNEKLSLDRAKTCYDYLLSKGVQASRMKYAGYGESRPIADNNTPEGRELNRRMEFIMLVK
jgi:outer membrane protein OmpA-like peptidoglycan-associated protein